jgi:hypothetical protein
VGRFRATHDRITDLSRCHRSVTARPVTSALRLPLTSCRVVSAPGWLMVPVGVCSASSGVSATPPPGSAPSLVLNYATRRVLLSQSLSRSEREQPPSSVLDGGCSASGWLLQTVRGPSASTVVRAWTVRLSLRPSRCVGAALVEVTGDGGRSAVSCRLLCFSWCLKMGVSVTSEQVLGDVLQVDAHSGLGFVWVAVVEGFDDVGVLGVVALSTFRS